MTQEYIDAMWLQFLRAPSKRQPDDDGKYSLGEIGETSDRGIDRPTPYSPGRVKCTLAKSDS